MVVYVVEDELHAESIGRFNTRAAALAELRRLSGIPWDQQPNQAPCTNWRNCGRNYELVEFEVDSGDWKLLSRSPAFEISAKGVKWSAEVGNVD